MAEKNNEKIISIPKKSEKLAEFVGIVLGDGNIYSNKKYGVYNVRIAGDSRKDKEYLEKYVASIVFDLFGLRSRFYYFKKCNGFHLCLTGRRLVDFLTSIGLKEGDKVKNQVGFPDWIWEKEEYLKSCLRGLIDTDGTINEMLPQWPGLFQMNFENFSLSLLEDVRKAFFILGYNPSKIYGKKTPYGNKLSLTRKKEIQKFYKEIRFHNPKHQVKYSPMV